MRRTITFEEDEEIVVSSRRHDVERKPPFFICGTGDENRMGRSMNVIKTLSQLSPSAIKLFELMLRLREKDTNMVVMRPDDAPSPRFIANHMPLLVKCDLVRRVRRSHFMLNPDAVMPPRYRVAKIEWERLSDNKNDGLSDKEESPS
jgi:hypothetical protein